jgi:hypothetical protein
MVKLILNGKKSNGTNLIEKKHKKILLFGDNGWKQKHGIKLKSKYIINQNSNSENILASIR